MASKRKNTIIQQRVALRAALFLILIGFPFLPLSAELYKWTDEYGQVHFTDQPPPKSIVEEVQLEDNLSSFSSNPINADAISSIESKPFNSKKVLMYGASWCGYCRQARAYFKANNIAYTEKDIEKSQSAKRAFDKLGGGGIPLIFVGDKKMRGFSPARFDNLYN